MTVFDVFVNDRKICRAGVGDGELGEVHRERRSMARVDARFGLTVYGPAPSVSKRHQVASPEADMSTGREHPYRLRE